MAQQRHHSRITYCEEEFEVSGLKDAMSYGKILNELFFLKGGGQWPLCFSGEPGSPCHLAGHHKTTNPDGLRILHLHARQEQDVADDRANPPCVTVLPERPVRRRRMTLPFLGRK